METYAIYKDQKIISPFKTTETMCEAASLSQHLFEQNMRNARIFTDKCCWSCILYANKRTHYVKSKESANNIEKHNKDAPYPLGKSDEVKIQHILFDHILTPNCTALILKGLYMLPEIVFGLSKTKIDIKCKHLDDSSLKDKHFYIRSILQRDGSRISKIEREYIPPGENESVRKAYVKPIGAWINVPYIIGSLASTSYDFLLEEDDEKILSLAKNICGDIDVQCDIIKTPETERLAYKYLDEYWKYSPLSEEFNGFWYTYVENKDLYKYTKPNESRDIYDEIVRFKDVIKEPLDKFLEDKMEIYSTAHGLMKVAPKGTSDDIVFSRTPYLICLTGLPGLTFSFGWCFQYRNVVMHINVIDLFFNYVNPDVCCGYTQLVEMDYGNPETNGSTYLRGYLTEEERNGPALPYVIGELSGYRLTCIYYPRLMANSARKSIRNARLIRQLARFLKKNGSYQLGTIDENISVRHLPPFSLLVCSEYEAILNALDSKHPLVQELLHIRNQAKYSIKTQYGQKKVDYIKTN